MKQRAARILRRMDRRIGSGAGTRAAAAAARLRAAQPHAERRALHGRQLRDVPRHRRAPRRAGSAVPAPRRAHRRASWSRIMGDFKAGKRPATIMHQIAKGLRRRGDRRDRAILRSSNARGTAHEDAIAGSS